MPALQSKSKSFITMSVRETNKIIYKIVYIRLLRVYVLRISLVRFLKNHLSLQPTFYYYHIKSYRNK